MSISNELSLAIANLDWVRAEKLAREEPSLAAQWNKRSGLFDGVKKTYCLAIHEAIISNAPASTVLAIIEAHPDGVRTKESSYSRLPLHCACKNANVDPSVIAVLIKVHNSACLVPDNVGRLPIHYSLSNGADTTVIFLLLNSHPDSAKGVDLNGWSPLHVACSVGNKRAIAALLEIYPEATFSRTDKGSTPILCLSKTMENRNEVKQMLKAARQQYEATVTNPFKTQRISLLADAESFLV
jgi:ankyrin repeat protein